MFVEKVDIVLSFPAVDVYVAKEYAPDSCAYRVILAHENRHVAIARDHVARHTPKFRLAVDSLQMPTARTPRAVASIAEIQRQLEAELKRVLTPAFEQFRAEMQRAQAAIDTPAAYAESKKQCTDW